MSISVRRLWLVFLFLAACTSAGARARSVAPAAPAVAPTAQPVPGEAYWDHRYSYSFDDYPASGSIAGMAVFRGDLYVATTFNSYPAGMGSLNRWDGRSWTVILGEGGVHIDALAVYQDNLYVAGIFSQIDGVVANGIARWDGAAWHALGSGTTGIRALSAGADGLYAGGSFQLIDGMSANNIARWDGAAWHTLGSGLIGPNGTTPNVYTMAASERGIYASGYFTYAGGVAVHNLALWNGTRWADVGGGVNGTILSMVADGSTLYVGGMFTQTSTLSAGNLALWDGRQWAEVGGGTDGAVHALALDGHRLYVGGNFHRVDDISVASSLASWDGGRWTPTDTGSGLSIFPVHTLGFYEGELFVDYLRPSSTPGLIHRTGDGWFKVGGALRTLTRGQLAVSDRYVYLANTHMTLGELPPRLSAPALNTMFARWDGSAWTSIDQTLPFTMFSNLSAMANNQDDLYVNVTLQNETQESVLLRYHADTWSALERNLDGGIAALEYENGMLYAGGGFTHIGGIAAPGLARWNGTAWGAIGNLNGTVMRLAAQGAHLYAAGYFNLGAQPYCLARWDGTQWQGLLIPSSANTCQIRSLLVDQQGGLLVGGLFSPPGGQESRNISRWTAGGGWTTLASALDGDIDDLALGSDGIYASGRFTMIDDVTVNGVGRWDGGAWHGLGSGLSGLSGSNPILLATQGRNIYLTGLMRHAGGQHSENFAVWHGAAGPNLAPSAAADSVALNYAHQTTINVLANDGDFDDDPLAISALTQPAHGAASAADGRIVYRPTPGYAGSDSFTYTIDDGHGGSATATVTLTIGATRALLSVPAILR